MKTTIIVNYDAGWGNHITIRGAAPLSWDIGTPMESVGPTCWRLDIDLEDSLEFKPSLSDQVWAYGQRNYRVDPGQVIGIHPHFLRAPGWAEAIGYIPFKGRDVTVRLYTPPGYKENSERRYPVVYCLDGQSLFEPTPQKGESWEMGAWHLDEHLNALTEARLIEPLLVVGVDFVERDQTTDEAHGSAEEFISFLLALKATMDRNYPTRPEARSTGVLGATWGGLFALWAARQHPDVFGRVAALAPSFWWADDKVLEGLPAGEPSRQLVYLASGDHKEEPDRTLAIVETLLTEGWSHGESLRHEPFDPASGESAPWGSRIGRPLQFLFPWTGG
jgi:predicted alpha/beta superfamily hydrolase